MHVEVETRALNLLPVCTMSSWGGPSYVLESYSIFSCLLCF